MEPETDEAMTEADPGADRVAEIVGGVRARLASVLPQAASTRFPFGHHHAALRRRFRHPVTRKHPRAVEVAAMLREWADLHGGDEVFAWQGIAAALESIADDPPHPQVAEVRAEAARRLQEIESFISWGRNRLRRDHSERMAVAFSEDRPFVAGEDGRG